MNKNQFLSKLAVELSKLPQEEIEAAMEFYTEYLDDVGIENEKEAIEGLGGPHKIAAQIKSDYAVRQMDSIKEDDTNVKFAKKGISTMWLVLAGVFAAPFAIPVAIFIVAMIVSAIMMVAAIVFAAIAATLCGLILSIIFLVIGLMNIPAIPAISLILIGIGIIGIATISMAIIGVMIAIKFIFKKLIKGIHKINEKRIKGKMNKSRNAFKREGGAYHE